jgi:hypothetical protein
VTVVVVVAAAARPTATARASKIVEMRNMLRP